MSGDPAVVHGRETELALLREYLERAVAGEQQLVLLEGDPGIGKTALLRAFAQAQARRGRRAPRTLYLQAPDDEPYRPVHHAALAATSRGLYARLGGQRQAEEVARDLAPGWIGAIPVWGNLVAAVLATADALHRLRRRRAFEAIDTSDEDVAALLAASRRRPLVLLLDELERADADAIARLERLICTADAGARILILGAYRPTAPGVADPPVHSLRRTLPLQGEFFRHLRLEGLDGAGVEAWLAARFPGAEIPPALPQWLVRTTGGHPSTVALMLARLQARGAIRRTREGWEITDRPERLELPLMELSSADLRALPERASEVTRAASLLAPDFDAHALARLLGLDELEVEDQLALGVHYALLEMVGERELPDGEITTVYRFRSPHVRAVLRAAAPRELRERLTGARAAPGAEAPLNRAPPPYP